MNNSDKKFLVIKWSVNSFERAYNDKLSEYCDVLSVPEVYDVHNTDKNEIKAMLLRLFGISGFCSFMRLIHGNNRS